MNLEDLPPHIQKQVLAQLDQQDAAATKKKPSKGTRGHGTVKGKWRCYACGEISTAWARAERHADSEHHHRIEVLLHHDDHDNAARPPVPADTPPHRT